MGSERSGHVRKSWNLERRSPVTIVSDDENECEECLPFTKYFFTYLLQGPTAFYSLPVVWPRALDIRELNDFQFPPLPKHHIRRATCGSQTTQEQYLVIQQVLMRTHHVSGAVQSAGKQQETKTEIGALVELNLLVSVEKQKKKEKKMFIEVGPFPLMICIDSRISLCLSSLIENMAGRTSHFWPLALTKPRQQRLCKSPHCFVLLTRTNKLSKFGFTFTYTYINTHIYKLEFIFHLLSP